MSFQEKAVELGTSNTLVYECPATLSGTVHGLVFSNLTDATQIISLKFYSKAEGVERVVSNNRAIKPNEEFTWPKPINVSAGDRIIALCSNANAVTALASIYVKAENPVTKGFNLRGTWTTVANYVSNDVVEHEGSSFVAVAPNVGSAPPSNAWMLLSEKGSASVQGTANQIEVAKNGDLSTFSLPEKVVLPGSGAFMLPRGNSATRPIDALIGAMRYNSQTSEIEVQQAENIWKSLVFDDDQRFNTVQTINVRKHPGKFEFTSIAAAMDSITDASVTKPYMIDVGPGVFVEPTIVFKPYVEVRGAGQEATIVRAATPNQNLIEGAQRASIRNCTLDGATAVGFAAVHFNDPTPVITVTFNVMECRFGSNHIHVLCEAGYVSVDGCLFGSTYAFDYGFICRSTDKVARVLLRNTTTTGAAGILSASPRAIFVSEGTMSVMYMFSLSARYSGATIDPTSVGVHVRNGGSVVILATNIERWGRGLWVENFGAAPYLEVVGLNLQNNVQDLVVEHASTTGNFSGNASKSTSTVVDGVNCTIFYNDYITQGIVNVGPIYLGEKHSQLVNVTEVITKTPPLGLLEGGLVTESNGLNISIAAGSGYLNHNGKITKVVWPQTNVPVQPNTNKVVFINSVGAPVLADTLPDMMTNIVLGQYASNDTTVMYTGNSPMNITNFGNRMDRFNRLALGCVFVSGSIVSENANNPLALDVSAGHYFYSTNERFPSAKSNITFQASYRANGVETSSEQNKVSNTHWCNGTGLRALDPGRYTKHVLYTIGDGDDVSFVLAHGEGMYDSLVEAEQAPLPQAPIVPYSSPYIAAIITQEGNPNIVEILDLRPRLGFAAPSASAASIHSNLIGLENDDHKQYLLANGARAMLGDLDAGGHDVINVGTVDGVDVSDHSGRHLPNGEDALATAAPTTALSTTSQNAEGTANSFARSDHTHSLEGVQPQSDTLDGVSTVNANGFIVRTGTKTASARALVGTANQISVLNGSGVSGNPTISLPTVLELPGSNGISIPIGTTAQRPANPRAGTSRFNTDLSVIESYNGSTWVESLTDSDARFVDASVLVVKKNAGKGQFSTIGAAVAHINSFTGAAIPSATNRYAILVSAGTYDEDEIVVPSHVHITGVSEYSTLIRPKTAQQHLFTMNELSTLNFVTLENVGAGFSAIRVANAGDFVLIHKVELFDCDTGIHVRSTTAPCEVYLEYVSVNGGQVGIKVESEGGHSTFLSAENFYSYTSRSSGANQQVGLHVSGAGAVATMRVFGFIGEDGQGTGIRIQNGAALVCNGGTALGWDRGSVIENVGIASQATFVGVEFLNNVSRDFAILHPNAVGSYFGVADRMKVEINSESTFNVTYSDPMNNGLVSTGPLLIGEKHDAIVDIVPLITRGMQLGIMEGGELSRGVGLNVNIGAGFGYARVGSVLKKIEWDATTITSPANTTQYVYVSSNGQIGLSIVAPSGTENVVLGRFLAGPSSIVFIGTLGSMNIEEFNPNIDKLLRQAIGCIYVSGSIVTEGDADRTVNVSPGHYFYSSSERKPNGVETAQLIVVYKSGGATSMTSSVVVPNTHYDNGIELTPIPAGKFVKHCLYTNGDGANVGFILGIGTAVFDTLEAATEGDLPPPLISPDGSPKIAALIMQQGVNNIAKIIDIRPRLGGTVGASSGGGVSNHGDLLGLTNDDHPQYMKSDGARAMSGALNMGGNNIQNVGTINGLNIASHAGRHLPNGTDPLATAAPTTSLSFATQNSEGIANSLARSDHTHKLELSPIVGTAKQITVANGNLSENESPIVSIAENPIVPGTESLTLPSGTTAQRPTVATKGMGRFNETLQRFEWNNGNDWYQFARIGGDTFTGPVGFTTYLDFDSGPIPALPPVGKRRLYVAQSASGFDTVNLLDHTGLNLRIFRDQIAGVHNTSGSVISKGSPVYLIGSANSLMAVAAARANSSNTMSAIGLSLDTINAGSSGRIMVYGMLENVDTSAWAVGTKLYVSASAAGTFTDTPPSHPNIVQYVGTVVVSNVVGTIAVDVQAVSSKNDGTNNPNFTIGATTASSMVLQPSSTAQRTFTYPDASGNVLVDSLSVSGLLARTSAGVLAARTLTGTANQITVSNGDAVNGNPTIALAANVIATPGTYRSVTVDTYGRVTGGTNPSTLQTAGITDAVRNAGGTPSIQTGLISARPGAGTAGRIFIASDTGLIYSDTGTAWTVIGASSAQVLAGNVPQSSGTTLIPYDSSVPSSTEGTQLWSQAITPTANTSRIEVEFSGMIASNTNQNRVITVALFRNNVFIGAVSSSFETSDLPRSFSLKVIDSPNATTAVTYSCRIGINTSGTWYLGRGSSSTLGGTNPSGWTLTEIK